MSVMRIPWQWGALDKPMGLCSPVISLLVPHQSTRDLQPNTRGYEEALPCPQPPWCFRAHYFCLSVQLEEVFQFRNG